MRMIDGKPEYRNGLVSGGGSPRDPARQQEAPPQLRLEPEFGGGGRQDFLEAQ